MSAPTSILKAALLAAATMFGATAASAEEIVIRVYEKGYLPNIAYIGDATSIKIKNETGLTLGFDDTFGRVILNVLYPGSTITIPRSAVEGRIMRQPYIYNYNGRYNTSARFRVLPGDPPLQ